MNNSYYDLESCLCEEEKASVTFQTDVYDMGHLAKSSMNQDIHQNDKLELSLWLVEQLYQKGLVSLDLPYYLGGKFRDALQAGAAIVSMKERCPFYYTLGLRFDESFPDQHIPDALLQTFVMRYKNILNHAFDSIVNEENLSKKLSVEEQELYECGHQANHDFEKWKKGDCYHQASQLLNSNKRRRLV
eukprot:GCRY01004751.1.p1 GENE.GCRY01004751.1~~GCRY01004751.1.p1  ORF type:complete len:188 (-),score=15.38 GCRY01004751.1:76-639(-)